MLWSYMSILNCSRSSLVSQKYNKTLMNTRGACKMKEILTHTVQLLHKPSRIYRTTDCIGVYYVSCYKFNITILFKYIEMINRRRTNNFTYVSSCVKYMIFTLNFVFWVSEHYYILDQYFVKLIYTNDAICKIEYNFIF